MIFAPRYTRHERSLVGFLHLLGLDGDRTLAPRHEFRVELRERLVAEAGRRTAGDRTGLALAGR